MKNNAVILLALLTSASCSTESDNKTQSETNSVAWGRTVLVKCLSNNKVPNKLIYPLDVTDETSMKYKHVGANLQLGHFFFTDQRTLNINLHASHDSYSHSLFQEQEKMEHKELLKQEQNLISIDKNIMVSGLRKTEGDVSLQRIELTRETREKNCLKYKGQVPGIWIDTQLDPSVTAEVEFSSSFCVSEKPENPREWNLNFKVFGEANSEEQADSKVISSLDVKIECESYKKILTNKALEATAEALEESNNRR